MEKHPLQLQYRCIDGLPKLAWLAEWSKGTPDVHVRHGSCVETSETWFSEAAWDGPFSPEGLLGTEFVFGSGCLVRDDALYIVSSGSLADHVYYQETSTRVVVSNSLPFLLAHLGDGLDPAFLEYERINQTMKKGIKGYEREIPTRMGSVRRLMYNNLRISQGETEEIDKPWPRSFSCFAEYEAELSRAIEGLLSNARYPDRRVTPEIFSTQSTGYDSTAINAIAGRFGIDKVFTCPSSKEKDSFFLGGSDAVGSDDGRDIAKILGLRCIAIDRLGFTSGFEHEHLFHAGLHKSQDLNMAGIFPHVDSMAVLLTGHLGEVWYASPGLSPAFRAAMDDTIQVWGLSGAGMSEARLHAGLIHATVPFLGARRWPEILQICDSREMAPWRIGGKYDRPIARRIAESAGVPRESFGQKKAATIVDFPDPCIPYDSRLRAEFFRFLRDEGLLTRWKTALFPFIHHINNLIYWKNPTMMMQSPRKHRVLYLLGKVFERIRGRPITVHPLWRRLNGSLYCFSVNRTSVDYRSCCDAEGSSGNLSG